MLITPSFKKSLIVEQFQENYLKGNFFRCVRARAQLRALMTQKSCAVVMCNAILKNRLKLVNRKKD